MYLGVVHLFCQLPRIADYLLLKMQSHGKWILACWIARILSHVFMQCFTFESSFSILCLSPNAVLMKRLKPQSQTPSQTAVKPLISIALTATGKEAVAPQVPGGQLWAPQAQLALPGLSAPVTSRLVWPYANRRRRRTRGAKLCLTAMSSQLTSRTRRYSSYDVTLSLYSLKP